MHSHWKWLSRSRQVAPFRQGLEEHSSISVSHLKHISRVLAKRRLTERERVHSHKHLAALLNLSTGHHRLLCSSSFSRTCSGLTWRQCSPACRCSSLQRLLRCTPRHWDTRCFCRTPLQGSATFWRTQMCFCLLGFLFFVFSIRSLIYFKLRQKNLILYAFRDKGGFVHVEFPSRKFGTVGTETSFQFLLFHCQGQFIVVFLNLKKC